MPVLPAVGTLVWRKCGIALDHRDALDADAELLRRHLRDRDAKALAQVDLPAEDRHPAVGADREIAIDFVRIECLAERCLGRGQPLRDTFAGERKTDDERAGRLQELASGDVRNPAHVTLLPAARIIARRMRWWVPQRQRLPASASLASSR